ncbi:unnamed protein product [Trifolium pratense]|uniref:Uncharacterized protein n=1 Tax=Trifolium pratense TaxID=57577 RepID=A0ACB0JKA5_TRIPR|nr:unnamed protein product [Trifolium pratense]
MLSTSLHKQYFILHNRSQKNHNIQHLTLFHNLHLQVYKLPRESQEFHRFIRLGRLVSTPLYRKNIRFTTILFYCEMMKNAGFEHVLRYFDEDGDGKVSPTELRHKLRVMGEELLLKEVEMAIEAMDSDGDGYLSLEDLICLMEEGGEEQKLKDLREAFEMYDSENCGFITPKSLKRMLKKMGESKSIDECKAMIKHFDLNGDGLLSFDEFTIMMQ